LKAGKVLAMEEVAEGQDADWAELVLIMLRSMVVHQVPMKPE
jgi:hypothetical protein